MRNSYPTVERVLKIESTEFNGRFIFPSYSAGAKIHQDVKTIVVGAIHGKRDPLVKAFIDGSRDSEYVLVNVRKIRGFKETTVDVPAEVLTKVNRYNKLSSDYRESQIAEETFDEVKLSEMNNLSDELVRYFSK